MAEAMEQIDGNIVKNQEQKIKKKKRMRKDSESRGKLGICYISRVPPHMDYRHLRQFLGKFGEVQRIYLEPVGPVAAAQVKRKKSGRLRDIEFSEGWVEFTKKSVAKKIANMLNGEQIGGRKRSSFYYDTWNIKYLSKFKWDDLTDEIANKNRTREEKMALEISAAKRESSFYLSKVDQSLALKAIHERMKKKQKTDEAEIDGSGGEAHVPKIIRKFPQNKPVNASGAQSKPELSTDFLAGIFGAGL